ncbi:transporter, major facilitator family, putative [Babesia bigemina]|uniref:Transporter, major facilitator family, putative n=1 Tax=Babesia bigemina TaxID=5866 RepID=A0A061DCC6_BABBI|nr:transporter, major facilitator family, putative [Babesia bigemina]CDR96634.1 transporter, major facilitator family, putative [Babesia bigemina]|eukprot:XP_012768820.1 transporter, major facilitator family, putative [Babesia bigemina]
MSDENPAGPPEHHSDNDETKASAVVEMQSIEPGNANDEIQGDKSKVEGLVNRRICYIFALMAVLECFVNYDLGAMSVMVPLIQSQYAFSTTDLGIMGALPFLGLIVLSPIIGTVFTFFKARTIIALGLVMNVSSLLVFALAYNKVMFYLSRFLVGATQSFFVIYAPVWVGCFAPDARKNLWMAILQGSIVGGFMLGYAFTAILKDASDDGWRISIGSQMGVLSVLVYLFMWTPSQYINLPSMETPKKEADETPVEADSEGSVVVMSNMAALRSRAERSPSSPRSIDDSTVLHNRGYSCEPVTKRPSILPGDTLQMLPSRNSCIGRINTDIMKRPSIISATCHLPCRSNESMVSGAPQDPENGESYTLWSSCKIILSNPYFCFSTMTVSALFYVVTAIQYWTTKVAIALYEVPESLLYTLFVATSTTAPVMGVIAGSWIIDVLSARYPSKPIIIDLVLVSWTLVTLLCALSVTLWHSFYNLVGCIWVILFFGGGLLPPITLITINTISEPLRPMASSICMCLYHIFGYIGGTLLPGVIMDLTETDRSAIFATYFPVILGTLGAMGNALARYYEYKRAPAAESNV